MGIEELIWEGATLKEAVDKLTARLRDVNKQLEASVEFNGKKTAHLVGSGYKVTVQRKENVKWMQDRLRQFKENVPQELFESLFKISYEPQSKKAIDVFLEYGDSDLAHGIVWCREITPGAPQVTYQILEE